MTFFKLQPKSGKMTAPLMELKNDFLNAEGKIDVKSILLLPIQEYYQDLEVKGFSTVPVREVIQSAFLIHKIQDAEAKAQKLLEAEQGEYSDYIDVPSQV